LGLSFMPVKNFLVRGYYDRMKKNIRNQQTFEFILSYEETKMIVSAAYSFQKERALIAGQDITGISVNGSYALTKNLRLLARFDDVFSRKIGNSLNPWNWSKDGKLLITGIEFILTQGIKLAPNFQGWKPANTDLPFISRFCLNAEIKL
jgi:hypothetical protein